jgi:hypothetical protein
LEKRRIEEDEDSHIRRCRADCSSRIGTNTQE